VSAVPILLTLLAALLWAYSASSFARSAPSDDDDADAVLNAAFVVFCAVTLPGPGLMRNAQEIALMVAIGIARAAAQYILLESFRLAPASLIAPFEYTSLLSAFALSFLIWGDVPRVAVFLGAALIIASGALVIGSEWMEGRRASEPG
jgi:drug/metabolite transporter (DMT)-like permease